MKSIITIMGLALLQVALVGCDVVPEEKATTTWTTLPEEKATTLLQDLERESRRLEAEMAARPSDGDICNYVAIHPDGRLYVNWTNTVTGRYWRNVYAARGGRITLDQSQTAAIQFVWPADKPLD